MHPRRDVQWEHARASRRSVLIGSTGLIIGGLVPGVVSNAARAVPTSAIAEGNALYLDGHGLIVQADGDGGDTAQRMGWFWFGVWLREQIGIPLTGHRPVDLGTTITLLEYQGTGRWMRHRDQKDCVPGDGKGECPWKSDPFAPKGFSGDQQVPLIAALGVWGHQDALRRMRDAVGPCAFDPLGVTRCIQGTNDIVDPDHLNLFRRALGEPPTLAGDLQLMGSVGTLLAATNPDLGGKPNETSNDLRLVVRLLFAALRSPSDLSERARDAYAKNRAVSHGAYLQQYRTAYSGDFGADEATMVQRIEAGKREKGWQPECPRVLSALRWYFRAESGGNPALAELYAPIVDRYLS